MEFRASLRQIDSEWIPLQQIIDDTIERYQSPLAGRCIRLPPSIVALKTLRVIDSTSLLSRHSPSLRPCLTPVERSARNRLAKRRSDDSLPAHSSVGFGCLSRRARNWRQ